MELPCGVNKVTIWGQSRDLDKLHFHFNASLTSVNIAKVKALEEGAVLSMASVKVLCHDLFLMQ